MQTLVHFPPLLPDGFPPGLFEPGQEVVERRILLVCPMVLHARASYEASLGKQINLFD
jgi:hypothetical protein